MRESLKDGIRFFTGLTMLIFETGWEKADRPWLIVAALGLMGYSGVTKLASRLNSGTDAP